MQYNEKILTLTAQSVKRLQSTGKIIIYGALLYSLFILPLCLQVRIVYLALCK